MTGLGYGAGEHKGDGKLLKRSIEEQNRRGLCRGRVLVLHNIIRYQNIIQFVSNVCLF
jgi:hypothetical protein